MTTTATISNHPTDPAIVVLRTPPDMSMEMGRFAPARYDPATRTYLLLGEHIDSLRKFATRSGIHIVDQRALPAGPRLLMPECSNCSQPASLQAQPEWCPCCGERWHPVFIDGGQSGAGSNLQCRSCGRRQSSAFRWCGKCGADMPEPPKRGKPVVKRQKLANPKPFSECIAETLPDAPVDRTAKPEPITDTPLPEPTEETT